jgi:Mg2+-importing ATPase
VRTRLPFFKSLPGKLLSIATILVLVFVLLIPVTPVADWLGFSRLPLGYYWWMLLIIGLYLFSAELAKRWFYRSLKKRAKK